MPAGTARADRLLFAEGGARVLVSVPPAQAQAWQALVEQAPLSGAASSPPACQRLGQVQAEALLSIARGGPTLRAQPLEGLWLAYEQGIPRRLAGGA